MDLPITVTLLSSDHILQRATSNLRSSGGGGGGDRDKLQASKGKLPKLCPGTRSCPRRLLYETRTPS